MYSLTPFCFLALGGATIVVRVPLCMVIPRWFILKRLHIFLFLTKNNNLTYSVTRGCYISFLQTVSVMVIPQNRVPLITFSHTPPHTSPQPLQLSPHPHLHTSPFSFPTPPRHFVTTLPTPSRLSPHPPLTSPYTSTHLSPHPHSTQHTFSHLPPLFSHLP